jgi:outer membrane receptor protein involved in Fe transport
MKNRFKRLAGAPAAALLLSGVQVQAEEDAVSVTATRSTRPVSELPVSTTVLPREDLLTRPARSLDDMLRDVAGIQVQPTSTEALFPVNPNLTMRGLGVGDTATRTLVLVDGLPINGGFWGNVLFNRVPKHFVERVEVVRGSSANLFGSQAMGGVVNIVSRSPHWQDRELEGWYGTDERIEGNALYSVAPSDALALGLNANYFRTDGYFVVPEEDRRPIDQRVASKMSNLQGRANFQLSPAANGFVRFGYGEQERDGGVQLEHQEAELGDLAGGVDLSLGGGHRLGIRAAYSREKAFIENVSEISDTATFVSNRHRNDTDVYNLALQWSKAYTGLLSRFSAGVDYRRIDGENNQDAFTAPATFEANIIGAGVQTVVGLFAEASLKPTPSTEILAGLRLDQFEDTDGRIVTNGVAQNFADRTLDIASPRIAARWQFSQPAALRAAWYKGFRAPTLAERYRGFETPDFRGLPNPELKEERLTGAEAGVDFARGGLRGQLNVFENKLKDFIASEFVGFVNGKDAIQTANVAEIRSRGVEVIAEQRLTNALVVSLNYTYLDAEVTEGPLAGNKVEGAPENAYTLALTWRSGGWTVSPRLRYVDETFQDITNEAPQDAHTLVDFFASYVLRKNLELMAAAENLFDEKYIADGFSQGLGAPRRFSVGARLRF